MASPRYALLALGGFVVVTLSAGALYGISNPRSIERAYYEEALKNSGATEEVVLEEVHSPEEFADHALLLAYKKVSATRSPLMALAGVDLERFDDSVALLEETRKALADIQPTGAQRRAVQSALYPIEFLRSASALEQARRSFVRSGKESDGRLYSKALSDTARLYKKGLTVFKSAVLAHVPSSFPPYITVENEIDYAGFVGSIALLKNSAEETARMIAERERCFSGVVSSCSAADIRPPELTAPPRDPLSANALAQAKQRLLWPALKKQLAQTDTAVEPFLVLAAPHCTRNTPGTSVFLLRGATAANGSAYTIPTLVSNERLIDARAQTDTPFFKFFLQRGATYVPHNPFVYYGCLEYERDVQAIFAIAAVKTFTPVAPLTNAAPKDILKLKELEELLFSGAQALYENDAVQYVALAERMATAGTLSPEDRARVFDLALAVRNGSAGFENRIFFTSKVERENVALYKNGVPIGLEAPYLFYTRSNLSAFFMAYNPSFVGADKTLYKKTLTPPAEEPYLYYDSLSAAEKEKADEDALYYRYLHDNPESAR
jgi:hypothetical protein